MYKMRIKDELKGLSNLLLEIPTLESSAEGQLKGGFYAVATFKMDAYSTNGSCDNVCNQTCTDASNQQCNETCNNACNNSCTVVPTSGNNDSNENACNMPEFSLVFG